jgi:16S rRNA (guanine527-N7)-methyltransferase
VASRLVSTPFANRLLSRAAAQGIVVPAIHLPKLQVYADLLLRWNQRINLTALPLAGWPDSTLDRLFLEPLAAAPVVDRLHGAWVDLGSGGGSPALPLAVLAPRLTLTLTESRGKKAAFLREAVRSMPVPGATVAGRFEELMSREPGSCALVTCRAVAPSETANVATHLLASEGLFLYFGTEPLAQLGGLKPVRVVDLPGRQALTVLAKA